MLCDWKGEHLRLVLVCLAAALFPTSFLALCFWMMRHFKRRLSAGVYLRPLSSLKEPSESGRVPSCACA